MATFWPCFTWNWSPFCILRVKSFITSRTMIDADDRRSASLIALSSLTMSFSLANVCDIKKERKRSEHERSKPGLTTEP